MSEILDWLRSTIEGDKAAAEEAAAPRKGRYTVRNADGNWEFDYTPRPYDGEWQLSEDRDAVMPICPDTEAVVSGSCGCCCPSSQGQEADLGHIAIHDPRDTIARCEAELALLDAHKLVQVSAYGKRQAGENGKPYGCETCHEHDGIIVGYGECDTLRLLASGRRHRSGFNPEWVSGPS